MTRGLLRPSLRSPPPTRTPQPTSTYFLLHPCSIILHTQLTGILRPCRTGLQHACAQGHRLLRELPTELQAAAVTRVGYGRVAHPTDVTGLFLLDLVVGHARLLGPEAVLLRGRLSHLGVRACASASAGVERMSERAFLLRSGGRSRSPRPSRGRERSRPRECLASWRKRRKEDAFTSSVDGSRP